MLYLLNERELKKVQRQACEVCLKDLLSQFKQLYLCRYDDFDKKYTDAKISLDEIDRALGDELLHLDSLDFD